MVLMWSLHITVPPMGTALYYVFDDQLRFHHFSPKFNSLGDSYGDGPCLEGQFECERVNRMSSKELMSLLFSLML